MPTKGSRAARAARAAELETPVPSCIDCGRCCFSELPEYVRVFGIDLDRMDDRARSYTDFLGNRCYMRMEGGRCSALVLDLAGPEPRFLCSIYEQRPDVCRSLERGSGACRADRHEKAERPLLAIEALRRRPPPA